MALNNCLFLHDKYMYKCSFTMHVEFSRNSYWNVVIFLQPAQRRTCCFMYIYASFISINRQIRNILLANRESENLCQKSRKKTRISCSILSDLMYFLLHLDKLFILDYWINEKILKYNGFIYNIIICSLMFIGHLLALFNVYLSIFELLKPCST